MYVVMAAKFIDGCPQPIQSVTLGSYKTQSEAAAAYHFASGICCCMANMKMMYPELSAEEEVGRVCSVRLFLIKTNQKQKREMW